MVPYREYMLIITETGTTHLYSFNMKHELILSKSIDIKDLSETACLDRPFTIGAQFLFYDRCRKMLLAKNLNSEITSPV